MALDRETIERRLVKLEEYVSFLEELRRLSREEFLATPRNYLYAALQVAIQCVIDIGSHIVSGLNLGKVDRHGDIPPLLAKNGAISTELSSGFIPHVGYA